MLRMPPRSFAPGRFCIEASSRRSGRSTPHPNTVMRACVRALTLVAVLVVVPPIEAQDSATVALTVEVRRDTLPIADVMVRSGQLARYTDADGRAVLRLTPREHQIVTAKIGYKAETLTVTLR